MYYPKQILIKNPLIEYGSWFSIGGLYSLDFHGDYELAHSGKRINLVFRGMGIVVWL